MLLVWTIVSFLLLVKCINCCLVIQLLASEIIVNKLFCLVFCDMVDLQSKEQMLKKLYEHLCDKNSAIIKAEKTVSIANYIAA